MLVGTPGIFGRSDPAWLYIFHRAKRVISRAESGSPGPGEDREATMKKMTYHTFFV